MMENKNKVELNSEIGSDLRSDDIGQNNMITSGAIKNDYTPKIYQYLLGALGFVFSIIISASTIGFSWILLILCMTGGIAGVMALNYNTGCLISYYAQKIMQKISVDGKFEVVFVIFFDLLYLAFCAVSSIGLLMMEKVENGSITTCADSCWQMDAFSAFLMEFLIMIILNITTFVASINKLPFYQNKKNANTNNWNQ